MISLYQGEVLHLKQSIKQLSSYIYPHYLLFVCVPTLPQLNTFLSMFAPLASTTIPKLGKGYKI